MVAVGESCTVVRHGVHSFGFCPLSMCQCDNRKASYNDVKGRGRYITDLFSPLHIFHFHAAGKRESVAPRMNTPA
jgi:hypothetical protein